MSNLGTLLLKLEQELRSSGLPILLVGCERQTCGVVHLDTVGSTL